MSGGPVLSRRVDIADTLVGFGIVFHKPKSANQRRPAMANGWSEVVARRISVVMAVLVFLSTLVFSSPSCAQNPVPLINQPLVPETAAPGGPGFTLTVNGTGFVAGSVV